MNPRVEKPSTAPYYAHRHLRFGWWSLLLFAALGVLLELLHGFKVQFYLDVSNESRRLMWTLAHAHGIGLALVNIVFGLFLAAGAQLDLRPGCFSSTALIGATLLLPAGFFAGGVVFYSGDPGVGIALLPLGAAALLVALYDIALAGSRPLSRPGRHED